MIILDTNSAGIRSTIKEAIYKSGALSPWRTTHQTPISSPEVGKHFVIFISSCRDLVLTGCKLASSCLQILTPRTQIINIVEHLKLW